MYEKYVTSDVSIIALYLFYKTKHGVKYTKYGTFCIKFSQNAKLKKNYTFENEIFFFQKKEQNVCFEF